MTLNLTKQKYHITVRNKQHLVQLLQKFKNILLIKIFEPTTSQKPSKIRGSLKRTNWPDYDKGTVHAAQSHLKHQATYWTTTPMSLPSWTKCPWQVECKDYWLKSRKVIGGKENHPRSSNANCNLLTLQGRCHFQMLEPCNHKYQEQI
ncbi:hypothetical protein FGO68_gene15371 [Halteria grandinella]|uniref:Uncharacterized protein n=1 Tax=Halteria grandinella TaxID=5974 RepID=A0A8J8NPH6_HALGN|nr:hypothetical protein FGO68_gene15371 [Halteria grandinella]